MRRLRQNKTLAVLVAIFTAASAILLHNNPTGEGTIAWPVAIGVALLANAFLTWVLACWAAPFLASTGGPAGAAEADPATVRVVERWTAGTLMLFGALSLVAISLAAEEVVIAPTERTEQNAQLVRRTVEAHGGEMYMRQLGGADTWKMSEKTYRTCVPKKESLEIGFCVLVQVQPDDTLKVVRFGEAKSNAAQALEWHPELADEK